MTAVRNETEAIQAKRGRDVDQSLRLRASNECQKRKLHDDNDDDDDNNKVKRRLEL